MSQYVQNLKNCKCSVLLPLYLVCNLLQTLHVRTHQKFLYWSSEITDQHRPNSAGTEVGMGLWWSPEQKFPRPGATFASVRPTCRRGGLRPFASCRCKVHEPNSLFGREKKKPISIYFLWEKPFASLTENYKTGESSLFGWLVRIVAGSFMW